MDKTKNVFISHYHKDSEHIQKLRDLLAPKGYFIKNSSVEGKVKGQRVSDETIRRLLRMRIQWAGTFICIISKDTHTRHWVDWEIDQANKKGKRIVGVFTEGASDSDLPSNFKNYGDTLVGWQSERIIGAIEGRINNFENPDGSPSSNKWSSRSNC